MAAAEDLKLKLAFERKFIKSLNRFHKNVVSQFRKEYTATQTLIDMNKFNEELAKEINNHYLNVSIKFTDNFEKTEEQEDLLILALVPFFERQSRRSAEEINATTQSDISDLIVKANEDELASGLTGAERATTVSVIAATFLDRKLKSRSPTIALTETQLAAEASKLTEAEVVGGVQPSVSGGAPRVDVTMSKTWRTVGDNRVRPQHIDADGQTQVVNVPFTVGEQQLRFPGDRGLGASLDNVINCRCTAEYSK